MHSEGRFGLERGLVGWWRLRASDSYTDFVGANDATPNGGPSIGVVGGRQCVSFDGVNTYLSVPHYADVPNTSDYTVAAWINVTSTGCIFYTGNGSNDEPISLYVSPYSGPGYLVLESYKQSNFNYYAIGNADLRSTGWRHVAGRRSGSTFDVFLDGALHTSSQANGALTSAATNPVLIGGRTSDLRVAGSINDVRLYNRALSAAEVARLARIY